VDSGILKTNEKVQSKMIRFISNKQKLSEKEINAYSYNLLSDTVLSQVNKFHNSIPNYAPTPCLSLEHLSQACQVNRIFVKDESKRFDLKAFKVMGASFAMAKILCEEILHESDFDFSTIIEHQERIKNITFVTATDGNHGRAVAWSAKKMGCMAVVYLPQNAAKERVEAIKKYQAKVEVLPLDYDDCVQHAKKMADQNNWVLLQDTAFDQYLKYPAFIMQGYFSLMEEFIIQRNEWPSHIFVQAGVGSFAAAIFLWVFYFHQKTNDYVLPKLIIVEPEAAPCLFESARSGDRKFVQVSPKNHTIMAGLDCGTPSSIAWSIIRDMADAFITCDDFVAIEGMKLARFPFGDDPEFTSGESGAVCLGLIKILSSDSKYKNIKENLALNNTSKILIFSTEGITAEETYQTLMK